MQIHLSPRIVADSDILAGRPIVQGTQVGAGEIVGAVAGGKSLDEVARVYGMTVEDVRAALEFAAQRASEPAMAVETAGAAGNQAATEPVDESAAEEEARRLGLDPANLSPLGRKLLGLRAQAIATGMPLISSWEELDREMAEIRGEHYPDEDE